MSPCPPAAEPHPHLPCPPELPGLSDALSGPLSDALLLNPAALFGVFQARLRALAARANRRPPGEANTEVVPGAEAHLQTGLEPPDAPGVAAFSGVPPPTGSPLPSPLFWAELGLFRHGPRQYTLPRFLFRDPGGEPDPVRIGVFAALHGDEPATAFAALEFLRRLLENPALGRGYEIAVYPVCNPGGLELGTRHSPSGVDLNRMFWQESAEPEVRLLEAELERAAFQGVIALHADDTTPGVYAYVRGSTLTAALARPAIEAAEAFLPRARADVIDGFPARDALIEGHCFEGVLSNPAHLRPAPFELIFETPHRQPLGLQVGAAVAALERVLREYRPFLAFGQGL